MAIAHKVVSKAEGAVVDLRGVKPAARARELARADGEQAKDPRAVQVVLDQSAEIVRAERGVLIVPHPPRLRLRQRRRRRLQLGRRQTR